MTFSGSGVTYALSNTLTLTIQTATSAVRTAQEWIQSASLIGPDTQVKILESTVTVAVVLLLRALASALFLRNVDDLHSRYRKSRIISYGAFLLGIGILGRIWLEAVTGLATFLGLLGAGLAVAMRDPVVSLIGWLYIVLRRPFELGDRISIGNHAGDVIDSRIFRFSLLEIGNWVDADQSTGRVLHIPNSRIFTEVLANYTREFPYIWHEIPLIVTFESDWRRAKKLLEKAAQAECPNVTDKMRELIREAAKNSLIVYSNLTPKVWTTVKANGVNLTLRYLCEARKRRSTEAAVWEFLLDRINAEESVQIAYPTTRFFDRKSEDMGTLSTETTFDAPRDPTKGP